MNFQPPEEDDPRDDDQRMQEANAAPTPRKLCACEGKTAESLSKKVQCDLMGSTAEPQEGAPR